tara:strand:- start:460 stop:729 length:270 start_codon:yes stop_codon:yes gene_type:complete
MRKVKIIQRSVYHKVAEIEVNVPSELDEFNVQEWLNDNENLWVDDLDHKMNETEFVFGNGMETDDSWTDWKEDSEWRYYDIDNKTGGHL